MLEHVSIGEVLDAATQDWGKQGVAFLRLQASP
jgi:hypothetical protein